MKKTHIAAVILIVAIVIGAGFYVSHMVFTDPFTWEAQIEYMDPISDVIVEPDVEIFNSNAINPTVDICIGGGGGGSLNCQGEDGGGDENVDIEDGEGTGNGEGGN